MIKKLRKIKREIFWTYKYILFVIRNRKLLSCNRKKIFLLGSPLYKNLGDVAINLSELKLLKDNFKNTEVIEIPYELSYMHILKFKKYIKDNLILIIGGGFIGTVWIDSEIFIRNIITSYPKNKIIIMPQTAYFDSEKELKISKEVYSSHKNLIVCAREEQTYKLLKNKLKINPLLVPDSVLYLDSLYNNENKSGILFCMRDDIEKDFFNINKLVKYLKKSFLQDDIESLDNCNCKKVTFNNREEQLVERIKLFSNKKLIITDRLHGMIFGVLSGSVTIAFDNKTKKISNVYNTWLKNQKNVKCVNNVEDAIKYINDIEIKSYSFTGMKKEFIPVIEGNKEIYQ